MLGIKQPEYIPAMPSRNSVTINGSQINRSNICIGSIDVRQVNNDRADYIAHSYDYEDIFKHIAEMFSEKPVLEHTCHSCGAKLKIDALKHVFHCEYCGAVYLIGTEQIYAK